MSALLEQQAAEQQRAIEEEEAEREKSEREAIEEKQRAQQEALDEREDRLDAREDGLDFEVSSRVSGASRFFREQVERFRNETLKPTIRAVVRVAAREIPQAAVALRDWLNSGRAYTEVSRDLAVDDDAIEEQIDHALTNKRMSVSAGLSGLLGWDRFDDWSQQQAKRDDFEFGD